MLRPSAESPGPNMAAAPAEPDTDPAPTTDRAALDATLDAERLRLYQSVIGPALGGQIFVGLLLVAVLRNTVDAPRLVAWVLALAIVLALRVLAARRAAHGIAAVGGIAPGGVTALGAAEVASLLRSVRGTAIAQALVWGGSGVLLYPASDLIGQTFLVFVLAGITAGSLTLAAFDVRTAIAFALLTLLPLAGRLLATDTEHALAMAAMVAFFAVLLVLPALRGQRNVREAVAVRITEAQRAGQLVRNQRRLEQLSSELTRQSEALTITLDHIEQGIMSLDTDGRLVFHNRRLAELLGLPEDFLAGRPTMEQISRHQLDHGHYGRDFEVFDGAARASILRWFAGERPEFPLHYLRRTVSGLTLEVKSHYLRTGGLVRTFSDVTGYVRAQQQLQASQAQAGKLALVAAHTDNAVAIVDAQRRVEWINDGFERLSGFTLADLAGRPIGDSLRGPHTDPVEVARMDADLARDNKCAGELLLSAKDGRPFWLAIDTQAIVDAAGAVQQYVSIGRDVTARKQAEQALREARDEAERASRAKSEFLSAMSHELRTPLNAIIGFAQLLESDPAHPLPGRQRGQAQQILRAGHHLLELINDVLDLARVEAGKPDLDIEPVAAASLVAECVALLRPLAEAHEVRLEAGPEPVAADFVAADRTRLKQVLLNLLTNAIKYNRRGGSVQVRCERESERESESDRKSEGKSGSAARALRISVADTGPGLTAEQSARLFVAFERLGAEAGRVPGAGIGLALSKRLVELMHGTLDVDSEAGRGSVFWVELARTDAPAPGQVTERPEPVSAWSTLAAPPAGDEPAPSRHVLYIEDNEVNVLLMEAALDREPGVRLQCAPLPELGLELAAREPPDLILLDIQLPGLDGYEVLRRLRAQPSTRTVPVVAVSANAMQGDAERALAAGFDGYLTKPFDLRELQRIVRSGGPASTAQR